MKELSIHIALYYCTPKVLYNLSSNSPHSVIIDYLIRNYLSPKFAITYWLVKLVSILLIVVAEV